MSADTIRLKEMQVDKLIELAALESKIFDGLIKGDLPQEVSKEYPPEVVEKATEIVREGEKTYEKDKEIKTGVEKVIADAKGFESPEKVRSDYSKEGDLLASQDLASRRTDLSRA